MSLINSKTIRSELTAMSNIAQLILHYKVKRPFSKLRLPKGKNTGKKLQFQKKKC